MMSVLKSSQPHGRAPAVALGHKLANPDAVPAAERVRLAARRREETDYIFRYWSALGWTILTLGIYGLYVFYQLVRRMRDHNARRLELLDAAAAKFRAVLYKDHFYAGMPHAILLEKLFPETNVKLFSGIVLNNASGGINPHAVDHSAISLSPCSPTMYAWTFCTATLHRCAMR